MEHRHLGAQRAPKRNCLPAKGEGDMKGGAIRWCREIVIAIGLVVALSSVAAAQVVTYEVAGIQTGVAEDFSSFAGVGASDDGDVAVWEADIERVDLTAITGGVFQLHGVLRDLSGVFTDGTIAALPGGTCRMEKFAVTGDLTVDDGSGVFEVILTHYGVRIGGRCFLYFATVEGTVTFALLQNSD